MPNLLGCALLGYALTRTRPRLELPMAEPCQRRPQYGRTSAAFCGRGNTAAEPMGPGVGAWPNHTIGAKAVGSALPCPGFLRCFTFLGDLSLQVPSGALVN